MNLSHPEKSPINEAFKSMRWEIQQRSGVFISDAAHKDERFELTGQPMRYLVKDRKFGCIVDSAKIWIPEDSRDNLGIENLLIFRPALDDEEASKIAPFWVRMQGGRVAGLLVEIRQEGDFIVDEGLSDMDFSGKQVLPHLMHAHPFLPTIINGLRIGILSEHRDP